MGSQVSATFDTTYALEAEGIPDATGGDVGFVDEVEDGVRIALKKTLADTLLIHGESSR